MTDYLARLRALDLDVRSGMNLRAAAKEAERIAHDAVDVAGVTGGEVRAFYVAIAEVAADAAMVLRAKRTRLTTAGVLALAAIQPEALWEAENE